MSGGTADWIDELDAERGGVEAIAPGAVILRRFVGPRDLCLIRDIQQILAQAPLRNWQTRGGKSLSVAMSNCGELGWISDPHGYRYDAVDPHSGRVWPAMPASFAALAADAARAAGYPALTPQACLINEYRAGTRLSLHQDRDELDLDAPIVSVSLGLPATFLFGGLKRADRPARYRLLHGDVVVWGGPSRLRFHGIAPLAQAQHPLLGERRFNLTFRQVSAGAHRADAQRNAADPA